jgi:lipopolysaccharide export system permease protein
VGLRGVLVADERDPRLTRIVTAREGRLLSDEVGRRVTLRLLDGAVHEADVTPAGAAGPDRYRSTRFAVYDMTLTLTPTVRLAGRLDKPERSLGLRALRAELARLRDDPVARRPWESEFHKRLALPVAAGVFSLVGFPLAIRAHRGGRSVALAASLVIILTYYLLLTSLENLALRGRLPIALAVWMPNAAFLGLGGVLVAATAWPRRRRGLGPAWVRMPRRVASWRPFRPPRSGPRWVGAGRSTTFLVDRYVLRQFAEWILLGLAVGAVLFVVVDLLRTLDRFLRVKPPLHHVAEHFLFHVPVALHQGLPVILLVATLFLFLTLNRHHELTALKAAGVSLYRVSAPVLLSGALLSAGAGLFQEFMLPILSERGEEVDRVKIQGQLPRHLQSRARLWLRSGERGFYRVELLDPAAGTLHGVTVLELDDRFRLKIRLDARLARWTGAGWEFVDGVLREMDPEGGMVTRPFARAAVGLRERLEDFTRVQKPPAAMSYRELREYVQRLTAAGFRAHRYLVDMYAKLSQPLENLIMILVAIPLALRAPRAGRLWGAGLALAIVAVYLVVDRSARALGQADLLPPLLAAWTANGVFLGLGASLFLRART